MSIRDKVFKRFIAVCIVLLMLFGLVITFMFYIQLVERGEWMKTAATLKRRDRDIAPNRGNIYTHDGKMISATVPYYTLLMDTRVPALHEKDGQLYRENIDTLAYSFANHFGDRTQAEYKQLIDNAYLAGKGALKLVPHKVSYVDLMEVRKFPLIKRGQYKSGFMTREFVVRENLYGSLCARTIGNVYGAGQGGQFGLELRYDSILSGRPGRSRGMRIGTGWLYETVVEPIDGMDIISTIDIELQDICDKALREMLIKTDAERGCLLLMDVETGAIRASVNLSRLAKGDYYESYNMSVGDLSEPGSTFKMVSLMVGLEDGKFDLEDSVETGNGVYYFDGIPNPMTDHNWKKGGYGTVTLERAIAVSSNIGISRMIYDAYSKNPGEFVDGILKTKIMDDMHIEIPGAAVPKIYHPDTYSGWSKSSLPWMSMGYVNQLPPIYTLAFYNAIANNGKLMKPYYVEAIRSKNGIEKEFEPEVINSSICSSSTLKKMKKVLEEVIETGTGKNIDSKYISIAGKTGTAQLNYGRSNTQLSHLVSFAGYFPTDKPRYSAVVVIRQPRIGAASGSYMAGGAFRTMAERVNANEVKLSIDDVEEPRADSVLPYVMNGNSKDTRRILNYMGIDSRFASGDWVKLVADTDEMEMVANTHPLIDGYVPDVRGMGAKDAVYLIEKAGMKAKLNGRGRVIMQSILPSSRTVRGVVVELTLR